MRRTGPALISAGVAILLAACGGGGSSTSASAERVHVEHVQSQHEFHKHPKKIRKEEARREKREMKQNREFREAEERRIAAKEERREKAESEIETEPKSQPHKAKPKPESGIAGADPITVEEYDYFKGTDLGNWEIAWSICAVTPEKQLAREYHTEQNWAAIGHAYGSDYREPFNVAAEEGCMAALKDTPAQRKAMWAIMEANE